MGIFIVMIRRLLIVQCLHMKENNEFEKLFISNIAELHSWLKINHHRERSIWLVKNKKDSGLPYISYDEIVDELICFGWVDSLPRKLDATKTMLLISPRNSKSNWSAINKDRVEKLRKANRLEPSGLLTIEKAKSNGTWDFLSDVESLVIPKDLANALDSYDKAEYYFNRFPNSSKRGILEWIKIAKKDETRKKRVEETAIKASKNRKANHPKGRDSGPRDD